MAAAIAALVMAACGSSDSGSTSTAGTSGTTGGAASSKVKKMAIALPEKANDYGWNQQGAAAAKAAADSVGASLTVADGLGYDNVDSSLRQLSKAGNDFIIAWASGYNTIAPRLAQQLKTPMLTTDAPKDLVKGLVGNVTFKPGEGAYLAGVLAAKTTKTKTVGVVSSADNLNWNNMTGGFIAGVRSVDPSIKIRLAQIGQAGYADAAGGKRVTQSLISSGADVILGFGDGASFGYLQAVETASTKAKPVWFIDVIGDKSKIDKQGVLLSSVMWDMTSVFKQAVKDINDGTYGTKNYDLGASNGISLLKTKHIPSDVWADIEKAKASIVDGSTKVPETPDKKSINALLNKQS
jgi:simple sugar transport system substrate-binding protein